MLTTTLTFAVALLAQAAPAAAPQAASPSSPAAAAAPASDPTVCRSTADTGTRFSHRECHTTSEWKAISAEAQRQVQQDQRMSSASPH